MADAFFDSRDMMKSPGFRLMLGLAAAEYFDNPYRPFNLKSTYNADPFFMGYFPVGMHLTAVCRGLLEACRNSGFTKVFFLTRDGRLPQQAFQFLKSLDNSAPEALYKPASRRSLLAGSLNSFADFFNLPLDFPEHGCRSMLEILAFCRKASGEAELKKKLSRAGLAWDDRFQNRAEYYRFMNFFLDKLFVPERLKESRSAITEYFKDLAEPGAVVVDTGRAGRVICALSSILEKPLSVFSIHREAWGPPGPRRPDGYGLFRFDDFTARPVGLFRECLLSYPGPGCLGYERRAGRVEPVYHEQGSADYPEKFILSQIQQGALKFFKDFWLIYREFEDSLPFRAREASLPLEEFLANPSEPDAYIFSSTRSDDLVLE